MLQGSYGKKLIDHNCRRRFAGELRSGAAFEILDAVSQHNQWAGENNRPDDRIEIDVLTGASAGGMTVAMIAQRLLFDGAAMNQPYDNPLYNAWVRDIDIVNLLDRQADEPATHSMFSSDCVIDISQTYLTEPLYREPAGCIAAPRAPILRGPETRPGNVQSEWSRLPPDHPQRQPFRLHGPPGSAAASVASAFRRSPGRLGDDPGRRGCLRRVSFSPFGCRTWPET